MLIAWLFAFEVLNDIFVTASSFNHLNREKELNFPCFP